MAKTFNEWLREMRMLYGALIREEENSLCVFVGNNGSVTCIMPPKFGEELTLPDGTPVADILEELRQLKADMRDNLRNARSIIDTINDKTLSIATKRALIVDFAKGIH